MRRIIAGSRFASQLSWIMIAIEIAAVLTEHRRNGFDVRDRRGKEGITLDDIRRGA